MVERIEKEHESLTTCKTEMPPACLIHVSPFSIFYRTCIPNAIILIQKGELFRGMEGPSQSCSHVAHATAGLGRDSQPKPSMCISLIHITFISFRILFMRSFKSFHSGISLGEDDILAIFQLFTSWIKKPVEGK